MGGPIKPRHTTVEQHLLSGIAIIWTMMRITAVAHGEVQGVGYRYFVTGCARAAGLRGYVKNQPDGSVLMIAEGERAALDAFVRMVKAEGDAVIRVDALVVTMGDANGEYTDFGVRW